MSDTMPIRLGHGCALALLCAACHRPALPPAPAMAMDTAAAPEPVVAVETFETRLAHGRRLWQELAPTGANHQALLAAIDHDDRSALASALVEGGRFACGQDADEECDHVLIEPAFDDPCLRRTLALELLPSLLPEDQLRLSEQLESMIRLELPERELQPLVFELLLAGHDDRRLELLLGLAEHMTALARQQTRLLDDDEQEIAAEIGVDAAVDRILERRGAHEILVEALRSRDLRPDTVRRVIERLTAGTDAIRPDALAATIAIAEADDCELAVIAASALDRRGVAGFDLAQRRHARPDDVLRTMCLVAAELEPARRGRMLRALVPRRGVDVVVTTTDLITIDECIIEGEHPCADATTVTRQHLRRADVDRLPFPWPADLEPVCSQDTCELQIDELRQTSTVTIRLARRRGELQLVGVAVDVRLHMCAEPDWI